MKGRKTEITIETFEVLVISSRGSRHRRWCDGCGKQVAVISIHDACMSGLSMETIERHAPTGRIHLIVAAGGLPTICLNSLIQI